MLSTQQLKYSYAKKHNLNLTSSPLLFPLQAKTIIVQRGTKIYLPVQKSNSPYLARPLEERLYVPQRRSEPPLPGGPGHGLVVAVGARRQETGGGRAGSLRPLAAPVLNIDFPYK